LLAGLAAPGSGGKEETSRSNLFGTDVCTAVWLVPMTCAAGWGDCGGGGAGPPLVDGNLRVDDTVVADRLFPS